MKMDKNRDQEIRHYRKNKISIKFNEQGENFTLDVPHKNKWDNVISYLRRRGFNVKENDYYKKEYAILSKYHKRGDKKDVVVLLEIHSSSISIEFGHIKNLWSWGNNFWDTPSDNRYTKLTYLEEKTCEVEVKKFLKYLGKWGFTYTPPESTLTEVEKIIKKENENTHIHGGSITCLEDIGKSITEDSYIFKHSSNDANKKKIVCGDIKYFYDYNKKLARGIVYHNINNMWWVLVNGDRYNKASHELFDFSDSLGRKLVLSQQQKVQRWKTEITKAEKKRNYKKAEALWKKIDNFTLYNVWNLKRNSWFAPHSSGYVSRQEDAGVYTKIEIDSNQSYYNNGETTKSILIEN